MFSFFRNACFLCLLLVPAYFFGQKTITKRDTVFCDCEKAREIVVKPGTKIGLTIPPPNGGEKNEISSSRLHTLYAFEKEHHTAWYKLKIAVDGPLSFDLTPELPEDDYDFMLYQSGKNNFCDSLSKNKLKPVRANISRDKNELKGKTGLSLSAKKQLVKEGVNDAYASSIPVRKGEEYYLIVDNVYENGGGHTIIFSYDVKVNIKGVVLNEDEKPVITNVTVTDLRGVIVAETTSDKKTGAYTISTVLKRSGKYSLNYYNDSSFVYSKVFSVKDTLELQNIRQVLPRLRKGRKYNIGSINFYGGSPEFLPMAKPSIENLLKLMQKNKNLKILIEGHVNCAVPTKDWKGPRYTDEDNLSLRRSETIRDYLVAHGIASERMETAGKGCSEMLFPVTVYESEMEQNRRVEIKVLEF